jgi:hypothetical protein
MDQVINLKLMRMDDEYCISYRSFYQNEGKIWEIPTQ